jgi:hypothetical protein
MFMIEVSPLCGCESVKHPAPSLTYTAAGEGVELKGQRRVLHESELADVLPLTINASAVSSK